MHNNKGQPIELRMHATLRLAHPKLVEMNDKKLLSTLSRVKQAACQNNTSAPPLALPVSDYAILITSRSMDDATLSPQVSLSARRTLRLRTPPTPALRLRCLSKLSQYLFHGLHTK